jgi:hypothetical protein
LCPTSLCAHPSAFSFRGTDAPDFRHASVRDAALLCAGILLFCRPYMVLGFSCLHFLYYYWLV